MKITIAAYTGSNSENFIFIKPLADSINVGEVKVFGVGSLKEYKNIIYYPDRFKSNKYLSLLFRLFNLIKESKNSDFIIGIYEIPHGFLAFLSGLILKKKTILCIIGNPSYKKLRKGFRLKLLNLMIKKMDRVTVTGSSSKNYLVKNGFKSEKIYVLPNSIDIEYIKPINISKEYDLITLGRLSPEKELINFLKIIKNVKSYIRDIKVGIAGIGSEYNSISDFINSNNLSHNVSMLGFVKDKVEFYNKGKLFVLTSSTEGLPRTVLESMACCVPCVVSNVGDIADVIVNGVNGIIIDKYDDIEKFTKNILSLLMNNDMLLDFSKKARLSVEQKYNFNNSVSFWNDLFNSFV